jgi:hypothetical protein
MFPQTIWKSFSLPIDFNLDLSSSLIL